MTTFAFLNIGNSGRWAPGDGQRGWPGMVGNVPYRGGWTEMAKHYGPQLLDRGYKRLWCHNPGGAWPMYPYDDPRPATHPDGAWSHADNRKRAEDNGHGDSRTMWIWQWLMMKMCQVKHVADLDELTAFHYLLTSDYGAEEIVYYFGGPYVLNDLYFQKLCIEDFVNLRGASFGFDALKTQEHFKSCAPLFAWIKKCNPSARIYTEPRPYEPIELRYLKHVDGTVAEDFFDVTHPVGVKPEVQQQAAAIGERITITADPQPIEGHSLALRTALSHTR